VEGNGGLKWEVGFIFGFFFTGHPFKSSAENRRGRKNWREKKKEVNAVEVVRAGAFCIFNNIY
jgi:hypothetical protein